MNLLCKNRYFRRECLCKTWVPLQACTNNQKWYFDYVKTRDLSIIEEACRLGHIDIVKKMNITEFIGRTHTSEEYNEVIYARKNGRYFEFESEYIDEPLHNSFLAITEYGHLDLIKYFAECGFDMEYDMNIALERSIENNRLDIVQYLVEECKVNFIINRISNDVLRIAFISRSFDVFCYLANKNALIYDTVLFEYLAEHIEDPDTWNYLRVLVDKHYQSIAINPSINGSNTLP